MLPGCLEPAFDTTDVCTLRRCTPASLPQTRTEITGLWAAAAVVGEGPMQPDPFPRMSGCALHGNTFSLGTQKPGILESAGPAALKDCYVAPDNLFGYTRPPNMPVEISELRPLGGGLNSACQALGREPGTLPPHEGSSSRGTSRGSSSGAGGSASTRGGVCTVKGGGLPEAPAAPSVYGCGRASEAAIGASGAAAAAADAVRRLSVSDGAAKGHRTR